MSKEHSVLVVDDQENWREVLVELLENEFEVISADSYEAAFEKIRERSEPFHVVVTDMRLVDEKEGNEDGLKLAGELKKKNKITKVVIITGYATIRTATYATGDIKVYKYLEKRPEDGSPFNAEKFLRIVHNAANESEKHRFRHDVFVIMPFAEEYKSTYAYVESASKETGLTCKRADESLQENSNEIMDDIASGIIHTRVVIAELSGSNPNVFFEIGISRAIGKRIISIARGKKYLTKMLASWRAILYEASFDGGPILSEKLQVRLQKEIIKKPLKAIQNNTDSLSIFIVTPNTENGREIYEDIILPIADEFKELTECDYIWDIIAEKSFPQKVEQRLRKASLVIVDLSEDSDNEDSQKDNENKDSSFDPDAFYLAGIAYGANKKYIFLFDEAQEPPFDIAGLSLLRYSKKTRSDRNKARGDLKERISRIYGTHEKHILFMAANPSDTTRLRLGKEFRKIKKEVEDKKNVILEMPELALRPQDLSKALLKKNAQIIHFSGHGGEDGELLLENENGEALPAAPRVLASLFKQFSEKIKCVVLNACYSEKQAVAIAKHIDYVIGMCQSISDDAAIAFSIGFYQALGAGETIEEAFELGKTLSGLQNSNEFDTPVLLGKAVQK